MSVLYNIYIGERILDITLEDLQKAIIAGGTNWGVQNNEQDRKTKFIYDIRDFKTLKLLCDNALTKEEDRKYAYHRWVNFCSSIYCEQLFCKYGAEKVENRKDKNKDIYIDGIEYDVKLTTYPLTSEIKYNLDTEDYKAQKWSELENVRYFYDFFKSRKNEFEK